MEKKPATLGIVLGLGPKGDEPEPAEESNPLAELKEAAALAFIKAVKDGDADGLVEAFSLLMAHCVERAD